MALAKNTVVVADEKLGVYFPNVARYLHTSIVGSLLFSLLFDGFEHVVANSNLLIVVVTEDLPFQTSHRDPVSFQSRLLLKSQLSILAPVVISRFLTGLNA